jgi:hypothetical protein
MEEDSIHEWKQDNRLNEGRKLCDHSRSDCMWEPEQGVLKLQSFLESERQSARKDGVKKV